MFNDEPDEFFAISIVSHPVPECQGSQGASDSEDDASDEEESGEPSGDEFDKSFAQIVIGRNRNYCSSDDVRGVLEKFVIEFENNIERMKKPEEPGECSVDVTEIYSPPRMNIEARNGAIAVGFGNE